MYCISIEFNLNFSTEIQNENQNHLIYIASQRDKIFFGGVLQNEENIKNGIVYIVKFNSYEEAFTFLSKDPYFNFVENYQINKFSLKINSHE
ncbi:MAG: hypothetical protein ACI8ZX_002538 [Planctomycetota bacterium]|jgi:uncharacterized protein YciI